MANTLAKIIVPSITDPQYAEKLSEAFENINNNFKIIASLPYLQGAQGDSFSASQRYIWVDARDIEESTPPENKDWAVLSEYGKVFIKTVFGEGVLNGLQEFSFATIRLRIGQLINNISPIDSFINPNNDNLIINNVLYTYSLYNDANDLKIEYTGQYFYFIDKRIIVLGTAENINDFVDYSGFFAFRFRDDIVGGDKAVFEKIGLMPTLYYDETANDICWKFNDNESGISAIGIPGKDGKAAKLNIVKTYTDALVGGVATLNSGDNSFFYSGAWHETPEDVIDNGEETQAIICFYNQNSNTAYDWSFGTIKNIDGEYSIYWDTTNLMKELIANVNITNYFKAIGSNTNESPNDVLNGIILPCVKDNEGKRGHVLRDSTLSTNEQHRLSIYPTGNITDLVELPIIDDNADGNRKYYLDINKYAVGISNTLNVGNGATINNGANINGNTNISGKTKINNTLEVTDDTNLKANVTVNGTSKFNNTVIIGNDVTKLYTNDTPSGSIGASAIAIETAGKILASKDIVTESDVNASGYLRGTRAEIKNHIIFPKNDSNDDDYEYTHVIGANGSGQTGENFGGDLSKIEIKAKNIELIGTVGVYKGLNVLEGASISDGLIAAPLSSYWEYNATTGTPVGYYTACGDMQWKNDSTLRDPRPTYSPSKPIQYVFLGSTNDYYNNFAFSSDVYTSGSIIILVCYSGNKHLIGLDTNSYQEISTGIWILFLSGTYNKTNTDGTTYTFRKVLISRQLQ